MTGSTAITAACAITAVVVRPKMTIGMGYSKISGAANSPATQGSQARPSAVNRHIR